MAAPAAAVAPPQAGADTDDDAPPPRQPAGASAAADDADADDAALRRLPSIADIRAAAVRVRDLGGHCTPVVTCASLDRLVQVAGGARLHLKCEIFQKGGAFKFRGAANAVAQLTAEERAAGVITHSSGNHAGALALAAKLAGVAATIVVPRTAPACKLAAVCEAGAELVLCEPTMAAREQAVAERSGGGAVFVPPYNDARTIAGQGTLALEWLEQQAPPGGLDVLLVPVSGGGMLSGVAIAARALSPRTLVLAAEPSGTNGAADVAASLAEGRLVGDLPKPLTIADGLQARLGDLTWAAIRAFVDGVVVVSEQEILAAMQLVMERAKLVVEPSGAVGVAAALSPAFAGAVAAARQRRRQREGRGGGGEGETPVEEEGGEEAARPLQVGVVLCGGNLDFARTGFWRPELWRPADE